MPRKRKGQDGNQTMTKMTNQPNESDVIPEELQVSENHEISINYLHQILERENIIVDDIYAFHIALHVLNEDPQLKSVAECKQRLDWPK